ncbi:hypothetical protein [Olivibacter sitiensis]|uniref:hypothetical protein n=1 Tax=Olivibacter sitiensis TaxID=376470 RepID=UPI000421F58B|nr:hypothetical protein [Olivibacter sitiensis]
MAITPKLAPAEELADGRIAAQAGGTMQGGLGKFASRDFGSLWIKGMDAAKPSVHLVEGTKIQQTFHSRKSSLFAFGLLSKVLMSSSRQLSGLGFAYFFLLWQKSRCPVAARATEGKERREKTV